MATSIAISEAGTRRSTERVFPQDEPKGSAIDQLHSFISEAHALQMNPTLQPNPNVATKARLETRKRPKLAILILARAGLVRPDVWCKYLAQASAEMKQMPIVMMLDKHPTGGQPITHYISHMKITLPANHMVYITDEDHTASQPHVINLDLDHALYVLYGSK